VDPDVCPAKYSGVDLPGRAGIYSFNFERVSDLGIGAGGGFGVLSIERERAFIVPLDISYAPSCVPVVKAMIFAWDYRSHRTAMGRPGDPVAPLNRTGVKMNRNSYARSLTKSSKTIFSRFQMPFFISNS